MLPNHDIREILFQEHTLNSGKKIFPNTSHPIEGLSLKSNIPLSDPLVAVTKSCHVFNFETGRAEILKKDNLRDSKPIQFSDQKSAFNMFPIIVLNHDEQAQKL